MQLDDGAGPAATTVLGTNIYETRAGRELTTPRPDARSRGQGDLAARGSGNPDPDDLPPGYEFQNSMTTPAAAVWEPSEAEEPPQYMTMMPPSPTDAPQYMSTIPVSPSEADNQDAHRGLALLSRLIGIQHATRESDGFKLSLSFDHGSNAGHRGSGSSQPTQGTAAAVVDAARAAGSAGTSTSNAPSSTVTHSGHRQSKAMQDLMADFSIDTPAAPLGEDTDDLMDLLDLAT